MIDYRFRYQVEGEEYSSFKGNKLEVIKDGVYLIKEYIIKLASKYIEEKNNEEETK